ncbi:trans-sialidase [Trypanosoma cruzi Dm28c]|uniref:Trans-sialidase n=2 Tax=Trypanosoma cruzi TaxID=5693 RepID=V5CK68_TRYCR|nr:trans-sialidase [Trypanosoma cruzi Dm28c]PBJ76899.1 trans-sialidase [Trypanosoma cruzi cruzi]PWV02032.1 putative trans-sialidase, Group V [Trypanosoma cruzi]
MLSRVAAVKAPRTHNRRRVTGPSGRRREGKESEPQRPNVSRSLFTSAVPLLLFVMMCCGSGGAAQDPEQASERNYKWKDIKEGEGVTVESLVVPGLLKVGNDVFAVAEARCKKSLVSFTGIASRLLTTQKVNTPVEIMNEMKETQFLEKDGSADPKKKVDVSRPTTVVKGNDIYMLVGKYSPTAATDQDGGAEDWGLLLVKGEVCDEVDSGKRIKWKDNNAVSRISVGELDSWTGLIGSGGSGIKMKDDTLVFPVEGSKKENKEGEKSVSLIIHNSKDTNEIWKLSKGIPDGGCGDPSIAEWGEKDKKLIMMTACDDGRRRVYESGDMGDSWTEALGTLSRVWGNKKDKEAKGVRSGFITATIDGEDNRNVMLVTLPVYPKETDKKEKGELHLWLTDNTHIADIGPVSDDDAAASSLLYKSGGSGDKKEELIALYEKKKEGGNPSPGMVSVLLTEQLQRVKEVLATWKKVDETVSKLCPSKSAQKDGSPEDVRSTTVKITDGLVGFLSDNFSGNTWRDEYLGVNATVRKKDGATEDKGATKTSDGVKFTGAWAEWPVGSQGENQLYHFANYNFTLVATVSIDGVPQEGSPIPLMGARWEGQGENKVFGLSYDSEKKRIVFCGGGTNTEDKSVNLATETTHHVAIVLRNGTQGSAYVNAQRVGGDVSCALENKDSEAVSHFYIGGDGNSAGGAGRQEELSVTVTNVLLYNRPLSTAEITALNPNKVPILPVVPDNGQVTLSQSSSAGQLQSEQGQPKGSIAAGAGGASTPAKSTAAASSGQEPVNQLTSGTSPSGNKNADGTPSPDADATVTPGTSPDGGQTVDGGSTADSEPTAETREGGTNGQEKEVNSHKGEVNATALSSLGNVSQGNNSDAGTVCGSGLLPSLPLLLGLWGFAAL